MDEYIANIQLMTTIVQAVATVAIAAFALATWKATRLYSKISGLALLEEAIRLHGSGQGGPSGLYLGLIRILRREFRKETQELEQYLPRD